MGLFSLLKNKMPIKFITILEDKIYHFIFVTLRQQVYFIKNGLLRDNQVFTHLTMDEKILIHRTLKNLHRKLTCVEIGSYLGASACFIANAISKSSKLYCIDTWRNDNIKYAPGDPDENKDTYEEFRHNISNYQNKIIMIRNWSTKAIKTLKSKEKHIDFLFIDGDHHFRGVFTDWSLYSPMFKPGSIVVFHDTGWAIGVQKVIHQSVEKKLKNIANLPNMKIFQMK